MGGGGGAASKDSSSKSDTAGYQQYYQQYMGGGSKDSSSKSDTAGYQQYYQQYMGGGGGAAYKDSSSKSNTTGYQQYYQQYMGGGSSKSGQGGYQQYYQQYMGGGKNSSSKNNTGSYQKYYQQFVGGSSNSSSGGYDQYYQQYIGGGAKNASAKSNTGGYQQYYQKYLGGSSKPVEKVTSCSTDTCVKEWYKAKKAHIKKFVPKDYQHFQLKTIEKEYKENLARIATKNNSTNSTNAAPTKVPPTTTQALPASPIEVFAAMPPMILAEVTSCSTDTCVKEWYKEKKADVKKFVPKDYQHFQLKALEKEYNKNLARIATKNNSTNGLSTSDDLAKVPDALAAKLAIVPPMLLAQVSACTTKQCVENWRDKTEAEIESVVPKDYQHFAVASIQKEYKKNLARVAQANASNSTNSTGAFLAATKATPQSFSGFLFVAIALFALVPGFFVLRLRARQRKIDLEEDVLRYSPMLDA
jgi:hypothetical protein